MTPPANERTTMHGKIYFGSIEEMTEFLIGLVGKTTATWEAKEMNGRWVVEFAGGY